MSGRPEVLFLPHRIPYPPDKGDKIRSWRLLKHLADRFDVHLACFVDDPADLAHTDYLRSLCRSAAFIPLRPQLARWRSAAGLLSREALSLAYFRGAAMKAAVAARRARPLAVEIAFSSTMAQYLDPALEGRPRIVDFCDSDAEKWREYARDAAPPPLKWVYAREARLLAQAETEIANWADASFAVTREEAAVLNARSGMRRKTDWWSNGVDTDYFSPITAHREAGAAADIVFTGAMDYRANVEAAHDFLIRVWPKVRAAAPDARFAIVGARPARALRARNGRDGVVVTGRVEDVRPWLQGAKIAIAPLRVARGIQNKVLEAMAMAKPVVATTAAATGIDFMRDKTIAIADEPDAMAQTIVALLNDENARAAMGQAARGVMLERYRWDAQLGRFDAALDGLLGASSSSPPARASA